MSKPALGRGLGDLMSKTAAPKQLSGSEAPPEPAAGPGVSSLLKGRKEHSSSADPDRAAALEAEKPAAPVTPAVPHSEKSAFPIWYLYGADLLLVALALFLIFREPANVGWGKIAIASGAVLLGSGLAIAAAYLSQTRPE